MEGLLEVVLLVKPDIKAVYGRSVILADAV
jgi:hypothetical protein